MLTCSHTQIVPAWQLGRVGDCSRCTKLSVVSRFDVDQTILKEIHNGKRSEILMEIHSISVKTSDTGFGCFFSLFFTTFFLLSVQIPAVGHEVGSSTAHNSA